MPSQTTTPCRPARITRISAVALLATALASGTLVPAYAGPDDGKIVTTKGHVDAPKAFWAGDTFTLKNEANVRGNGPEALPLEDTVNWIGKGYSGDKAQKNQFIFTTDDTPSLAWLGKPGLNYYMAPQLPIYNHDPIWAGMGADSDIPVEKFRDSTFVTDILSVDGPGTMELFRYSDFGNMADSERMLSSTALGLHSYRLQQGTHSHNYTVFSKPGRYEVTYRTVARSNDGKQMISSEPTTLVWQVGGQKPISGEGKVTSISTEDRYKAASSGNLASANYSLKLTPHAGREKDGDDKLTDITFTSASTQDGTLTLFNNGYFLTDLDVKNGQASWEEMLGSENSQIQAVFTPAQQGARWISPALGYEPGKTVQTNSSQGEGTWPTKIQEKRNTTLPTGNYTPSSADYTATLEPTDDPDVSLLRVEFADKNFRGFISGGLYSEGEDYPETPFSATVVDGVAEQYVDAGDSMDGSQAKLEVIPHPDMNARVAKHTFAQTYDSTVKQSEKAQFELTDSVTSEKVVPAQPEPAPAPETKIQKCLAGDFAGKYPLARGHVDIKATLAAGAFSLGLKDDTALINRASIVRSLDDVVLTVGDNALRTKTELMNKPELNFLGSTGSQLYILPQTQNQGIIWPGYSTENVDYSKVDGALTLHLEPQKIPNGARYGLFQDRFGGTDVVIDSSKGQTTIEAGFPTHVHTNWAFTHAGNYSFKAYYTAKLKNGSTITTPAQQLSFAVGKQAVNDCVSGTQKFTDVTPDNQFYQEIQWLAGQNITTGWSDGTFRPVQAVERGAMAAFFYRMAGSPAFDAPAVSPFKDVPTTHQFYKEITWLRAQGITTGWSDGTFRPDEAINRDAIAAFFYRYAGSPKFAAPSTSPFTDVKSSDLFYREITWLASTGITKGWEDGTFRPLTSVNRDAMAAFIYRFKNK